MKEWCMEHPYMTFFIVMTGITTLGNIVTKIVDVFIKPTPATINMNIDPTKLPGLGPELNDLDGTMH